ncbi:MAG: GldG family protein [Roseiflexaceae bacterium]
MQTVLARIKAVLGLRSVRYGANASAMSLLLIALVVMINVLGVRYHQRFDVTANKEFSISQQSKDIVQSLQKPLEIVGYYGAQDRAQQDDVESRLKEYRAASAQLSYRFVNPDTDPVATRADNVNAYGTLVFKYDGRTLQSTTGDEKGITSTILKLTQNVQTKVYVLTGHRERSLDTMDQNGISELKVLLEEDNFTVEPINLTVTNSIPVSDSVLLIADPQDEITSAEFNSIIEYTNQGGRVVLLSNPLSTPPLDMLMQIWGLEWQNDIIIDQQSQIGNPVAPAVLQYPFTELTRNMAGQATVFNSARSIKEIGQQPEGYTRQVFLASSERSSAATDFSNGEIKTQESDAVGPLNFGYILESPTTSRVVVIGDADFISNGYIRAAQANATLIRNAIAWAGAQDALINLPLPEPIDRQIFLTDDQSSLIFYSCVLGLPLLFVVTGIAVWWRRR